MLVHVDYTYLYMWTIHACTCGQELRVAHKLLMWTIHACTCTCGLYHIVIFAESEVTTIPACLIQSIRIGQGTRNPLLHYRVML